MGCILYRCSNDFPARIPGIVSSLPSPAICKGGPEENSASDSAFKYEIERGLGRISIWGSVEEGVMIVMITGGSWNPRRGRACYALFQEVLPVLLEAGLKEITNEEIDEFELRQKQKEAGQAVGDNDRQSR